MCLFVTWGLFIVPSCACLCLLPFVCFVLLSFATWSPKDFSTSDGIPTRDDLPDLDVPASLPEALTPQIAPLQALTPEPVPEALTQPLPQPLPEALTPTLVLEPEVREKINGDGANGVGLCQPLSPFGLPRRLHRPPALCKC